MAAWTFGAGRLQEAADTAAPEGALADTVAAAESAAPALERLLSLEALGPILRVVLILAVGFPLLLMLSRSLRRWIADAASEQRGMIVGKLVFYAGAAVLGVWVLDELGFGIAPLLGAAGILGVAIGFASQTSVSNIISGIFLMAEGPFVVHDVIQVGGVVGRVESIDTLSVKLRTFDNRLVRIPNEFLIKSEVTNITRYPIRRLDAQVGVAYKEDVAGVREILLSVAAGNPYCLMDPAPVVMFEGFGESSLDFTFRIWAAREHFLELKNTIHEEIKVRFDEEGVEIPFPHRTLYTGEVTDPFPIRIVDGEAADGAEGETGVGSDQSAGGEGGEGDDAG